MPKRVIHQIIGTLSSSFEEQLQFFRVTGKFDEVVVIEFCEKQLSKTSKVRVTFAHTPLLSLLSIAHAFPCGICVVKMQDCMLYSGIGPFTNRKHIPLEYENGP